MQSSRSNANACIMPRTFVLDPERLTLTDTATGQRRPLQGFRTSLPVVTIDAGHGVRAPGYWRFGAQRGNVTEPQLVRQFALSTAQELNERGYDVIITRDSDRVYNVRDAYTFRDAAARLANAAYISLHVNDGPANQGLRGTELFVDSRLPSGSTSHQLRQQVGAALAPLRVAHRENDLRMTNPFYIGTTPALVVETGYINHDGDFANITNAAWRRDYADRLANGIDRFHRSRFGARNITAECQDAARAAAAELMAAMPPMLGGAGRAPDYQVLPRVSRREQGR